MKRNQRFLLLVGLTLLLVGLAACQDAPEANASSTKRASASAASSTAPQPAPAGFAANHTNITTTYEEGGTPAGEGDGGQTNATSAWYSNWPKHLCGPDKDGTRELVQAGCDNLFYFALPCDDFDSNGALMDNVRLSPWANQPEKSGVSSTPRHPAISPGWTTPPLLGLTGPSSIERSAKRPVVSSNYGANPFCLSLNRPSKHPTISNSS